MGLLPSKRALGDRRRHGHQRCLVPMRLRSPGFSLIELLVALATGLIVVAAATRVLLTSMSSLEAHQGRLELIRELRTAGSILAHELRGSVGPPPAGPVVVDPETVVARLSRGFGRACQSDGYSVVLGPGRLGFRMPQAGRDSLLVFLEGADPTTGDDDRWEALPLTRVSVATCPSGDTALELEAPLGTLGDSIAEPGYAAVFTSTVLKRYPSQGRFWLGVGGPAVTTDPVAGPLTPPAGALFSGWDATGSPVAPGTPARVVRYDLGVMSDMVYRDIMTAPRRHHYDSLIGFVIPRSGSIYP